MCTAFLGEPGLGFGATASGTGSGSVDVFDADSDSDSELPGFVESEAGTTGSDAEVLLGGGGSAGASDSLPVTVDSESSELAPPQ